MPHQEINADPSKTCEAVVVRNGQEPIVVNLELQTPEPASAGHRVCPFTLIGEDLSKNSRERMQTVESELKKAHELENVSTGYPRRSTLTKIWHQSRRPVQGMTTVSRSQAEQGNSFSDSLNGSIGFASNALLGRVEPKDLLSFPQQVLHSVPQA